MLTFQFSGVDGILLESETLTSGMVGKQVKFQLSPDWDDLQKTAVYMAGTEVRLKVGIDRVDTIPWEVLNNPGQRLYVGLFGVSSNGTLVIPTIRVPGPIIEPGTLTQGDSSTDASLEVWAQILTMIGDTQKLDSENLVSAIHTLEQTTNALNDNIHNAVADYLEENPVTAGATAQEVTQIQQNALDILTLQEEKLGMDSLSSAVEQALAEAKASGTFDGNGTVNSVVGRTPDENGDVTIWAQDIGAVPISGCIMTGAMDMGGNGLTGIPTPSGDEDAANKSYVDSTVSQKVDGQFVPISGGTMTGALKAPGYRNTDTNASIVGYYFWPDGTKNNIGSYGMDVANRRMRLVQYAKDMDEAASAYGEIYVLPSADSGRTKWNTYNILTSKTVTYGTDDPETAVGAAGTAGRIYFKKVT